MLLTRRLVCCRMWNSGFHFAVQNLTAEIAVRSLKSSLIVRVDQTWSLLLVEMAARIPSLYLAVKAGRKQM